MPLTKACFALQLRQAGFPPQWPFAIHLLAQLHNYSLCAPLQLHMWLHLRADDGDIGWATTKPQVCCLTAGCKFCNICSSVARASARWQEHLLCMQHGSASARNYDFFQHAGRTPGSCTKGFQRMPGTTRRSAPASSCCSGCGIRTTRYVVSDVIRQHMSRSTETSYIDCSKSCLGLTIGTMLTQHTGGRVSCAVRA